jgi:hypothetical protein
VKTWNKQISVIFLSSVNFFNYIYKEANKQNNMRKTLTNKQALTKMINSLDPIQLGILRERILVATEQVLDNEQGIRDSMQADGKRSLIHPDYYFHTMVAIRILMAY